MSETPEAPKRFDVGGMLGVIEAGQESVWRAKAFIVARHITNFYYNESEQKLYVHNQGQRDAMTFTRVSPGELEEFFEAYKIALAVDPFSPNRNSTLVTKYSGQETWAL